MPRKNDAKSSGAPQRKTARQRGAGTGDATTSGAVPRVGRSGESAAPGAAGAAGTTLRLRRSDDVLASEIREILTKDPELDATEIEVDVEGGAVTLSGYVESPDAKLLAEELVETLPGVREVHNHLKVTR